MTKKIAWSIFFAALISFFITSVLILGLLFYHFTNLQMKQLKDELTVLSSAFHVEGVDFLQSINASNRITLLNLDGEVIYDSLQSVVQLENHLDREEIQESLNNPFGESVRYSKTFTQHYLYVAKQVDQQYILRVSTSQKTVFALVAQFIPYLFILFLFLLVLAFYLAKKLSAKILLPLEGLDLENHTSQLVYEELQPLLKKIENTQQHLQDKENDLAQKNEEFETIISKMKEAIIILDSQARLLRYNPAASTLFDLSSDQLAKRVDFKQVSKQMEELLENGLSGRKVEKVVQIRNLEFRVLARPIWSNQVCSGMVILCFDETEKLQLEKIRREFTANVTHELRTPLHIMSGYSEMMKHGFVSQEDQQIFITKIYDESQRMIKLVDDILQLAQIESLDDIEKQELNLSYLIESVVNSLQDKAKAKHIEFIYHPHVVYYQGNQSLLHSIIYNLCDNAIKYNVEHGTVQIRLEECSKEIQLSIQDTGVGIDRQDVQRIFERFYRVDKSRSKKVGGTGLGLSIVKHALQLHRASISIDSQLDKGSTFTIYFPKDF